MLPEKLFKRYQELQSYVGWTEADAQRVAAAAPLLEGGFVALVDDFYAEIQRHPDALKVITGGAAQIERLKQTLLGWLRGLVSGTYDAAYVAQRWRVGWRHVEIGLDQVYTNVALSRLRTGLVRTLQENWQGDPGDLRAVVRSLDKLLDLDLAIIEEAYQAERLALARQRSDATFHTLMTAAPCLIVIVRADLSIVYFSPFAERLTGFRAGTVLGQDFGRRFVPENGQATLREEIARAFAGAACNVFEGSVRCRDGTSRWLVWNVQLLPDHEGQPAVLVVGQDITSFKQAQEKVLQAERLAVIGQMMTGLVHESGNALARTQACLEMLALEVEDRPAALELITRAQKAQDDLRQLYEEVRGYASPIRLELEDWDLAGIWRQAWQNLAFKRQGRTAELREFSVGVNLRCRIDHFRMEQVFRNIFENSLAACKDPVVVDVRVVETHRGDETALQVRIQDNGPGLNPEQKRRIFEPFFTTKSKGTGLGMAIAKRIMDAHHGDIAVGAGAEGGAEIVLTVPRGAT